MREEERSRTPKEQHARKNHKEGNGNGNGNGGNAGSPASGYPVGSSNGRSRSSSCRRSIDNASFSASGSGSGSGSVSESSGSIVNKRMFERSAPPAPGGPRGVGLDRAWLAGRAHQAVLFGKGGENDECHAEMRTSDVSGKGVGGAGGGGGRGGGGLGWGRMADAGRRREHREADQLKLLDAIARGVYEVEESCVGEVGADFIAQVWWCACIQLARVCVRVCACL